MSLRRSMAHPPSNHPPARQPRLLHRSHHACTRSSSVIRSEINRKVGVEGGGGGGRGHFGYIQALELPSCQAGLPLSSAVHIAMATTQHGRKPQSSSNLPNLGAAPSGESLTVMVFSLLCFLPGDEDPRFWGERQETSSKLFSILDLCAFCSGSPKAGGMSGGPLLGKLGVGGRCSSCH